MLNQIKIEGKNEQELLEKYLKENNLNEADVIYSITGLPNKLFSSKKVVLNIINKSEVVEYIKKIIDELSKNMNLEIKYEVNYNSETINVLLISDNNSVLIGKDGRTLNSLQILVKQMLSTQLGQHVKLNLDVSNYKAKKVKNLEYEIKKLAKEVQQTKTDIVLDPMNSYERRIVHNIISEFTNLESVSEGEGKERKTIIKFKKKA